MVGKSNFDSGSNILAGILHTGISSFVLKFCLIYTDVPKLFGVIISLRICQNIYPLSIGNGHLQPFTKFPIYKDFLGQL